MVGNPEETDYCIYNNNVYKSLSPRSKQYIKELEQDKEALYDVFMVLRDVMEGKEEERTFLIAFHQYRPKKTKHL